ncbi:OmpA family protein [Roseibium suaedae]|uniref:Flagellar motor protein MotB n=1 Tax=Roseibium suaedae TaxID=735517 RepID=A0A1M7KLP8_9HYPH|nr:OmpA family protein [Roseibium suaedae]SHM66317.1 Flagellar motor protein MotB [Roseibium suaedae]
MRAQAKQVRHEEEEESAFVSMTDMTVGFLFIMMILLAFFASQARETETVPRSMYEEMEAERNDWRDKAEARQQTIARLEHELAQALRKLENLTAQVADLTRERDELKVENTALTRRIDELEKLIRKLQASIEEKNEEIDKLRSELERLKQVDPLEAYLSQVSSARREVLTRLRDAILADFPDLKVELSEESDALRFQGEGLFASGSPELTSDKAVIVSKLAARLDEILPCFTLGEASRFDESCNPSFAMVEAVQIEGHTDSDQGPNVNQPLSTNRANKTYFTMINSANGLRMHQNLKHQPVLSVAGYGAERPIADNNTTEGKATNRRIDLRFIMVTPQDTGGIELIREALEAVGTRP